VPANLHCGEPEAGVAAAMADPGWAPLTFTFGGIWEIQSSALEEVLGRVQVVDVRAPDEHRGPLGHIRSTVLIPIGQSKRRATELNASRPVVTVCRAGARSAQAVVMLQREGFKQAANLAGGMLRWRAEGHPVEGGSD